MQKYITKIGDANTCTIEIKNIVKKVDLADKDILRVIDLIYSWGGKSGRMFYAKHNGSSSPRDEIESNENTMWVYKEGIKLAKESNPICKIIFSSIKGIGSSYASKHAYFWSMTSKNPLIIIDSKIAGTLGYSTIELLEKDFHYNETIKEFQKKAKEEIGINDSTEIEKSLFAFHNHYFLNDNSNLRKNPKPEKDYDIAKFLADKLISISKY